MKIGRIEYLNLLPFYVFIKSSPLSNASKQFAMRNHSYPAKLNVDYLYRRIDSGFISSFVASPRTKSIAGIIGKGRVQSVLAILGEFGADYQSATSNALLQLLGIRARVLIGDNALRFYLQNPRDAFIDLAEAWFVKHKLPFVFGRFCYQNKSHLHKHIARAFVKSRIKIPFYILRAASQNSAISTADIRSYLSQIFYHINPKEQQSLRVFYRQCQISRIPKIKRFNRNQNALRQ